MRPVITSASEPIGILSPELCKWAGYTKQLVGMKIFVLPHEAAQDKG